MASRSASRVQPPPGKGVPASATRKPTTPSKLRQRSSMSRLRLIIRRLPPGLTEAEFWAAIGEDWAVGQGKVDWAAYKDGKVSKDPSKPSRPARAYLRVKEESYLDQVSAKVKQTTFQDAKHTTKDSCLIGPPSLEFAPYNRTPGSRPRIDGRQGTIDQDPEFIDFLQSLTDPVAKAPANGDETEGKLDKTKVTPLVQYIKDKKANKAKEAAAAKTAKVQAKPDAKDAKVGKGEAKANIVKKESPAEKTKREKAAQDAVKAVNNTVAAMGKNAPTKPTTSAAKDSTASPAPARRERERGNASVAAKILQRDLGLGPKPRRRSDATKAGAPNTEASKPDQTTLKSSNGSGTGTSPAQVQSTTVRAPPTGPQNANPAPAAIQNSKPVSAPAQRPSKPAPHPSVGAKSAFLKHANASQGVTEPLLHTAFSTFGTLTKCEIDKKKGFGYIDFEDTEALRKAMAASPIKVGNGQVVVLENKAKPVMKPGVTPSPAGSTPSTPSQPPVQPVAIVQNPASRPDPAQTPLPTSTTVSTAATAPAPPTAPRGAPLALRGGRGGPFGPSRGNFGPPNRGPRGGFRGRGGFAPNSSRGGRPPRGNSGAAAPSSSSAGNAITPPAQSSA